MLSQNLTPGKPNLPWFRLLLGLKLLWLLESSRNVSSESPARVSLSSLFQVNPSGCFLNSWVHFFRLLQVYMASLKNDLHSYSLQNAIEARRETNAEPVHVKSL